MKEDVLRLEGISFSYRAGEKILDRISLSLAPDTILCLGGASGCGKSTLLNIAGGFLKPLEGSVFFRGQSAPAPGRKRIMIFQDSRQLFPWLTVQGNIFFAMKGGSRRERGERAGVLLDMVGLAGKGGLYPSQLSGGMAQRGVIARALAAEPELLLLDEPFTALDAPTRRGLQDMLVRLKEETGVAMILVSHDLREAVSVADRVAILSPSGIVSMNVSLPRPRDPFSSGFISLEQSLYKLVSDGKF